MGGFIKVARLEDVPPGEMTTVETLSGEQICLVHVEDEIYAFQDKCSHQEFPLSNGEFYDHEVECSWHGARFDIRTGRALCLPAITPIKTYEVRVENGDIYVGIED